MGFSILKKPHVENIEHIHARRKHVDLVHYLYGFRCVEHVWPKLVRNVNVGPERHVLRGHPFEPFERAFDELGDVDDLHKELSLGGAINELDQFYKHFLDQSCLVLEVIKLVLETDKLVVFLFVHTKLNQTLTSRSER